MTINLHRISQASPGWHFEAGKPARDWFSAHAYRCDPLLDANRSCLVMVLDEDIECSWNGGEGQTDVVIHSGPASAKFGIGTLTLGQQYVWRTPPDRALLLGPPPNANPVNPWRMMDAWIDAPTLDYPWFPTIRILREGHHRIKAGTPIGSIREVVGWRGAPETVDWNPGERTKARIKRLGVERARRGRDKEEGALQWRQIARRKASIRREGPWLDVLTATRWLSAEVCDQMIADFEPANTSWRSGTSLWWPDFEGYPIVADALDDIGEAIEAATHLPVQMSNAHVVKWSPGAEMPVHIDVGGRHEYPERRWSSVIYLRSCTSGATIIPEYDIAMLPEQGRMLAWPGGHLPHGVEPADEDRYTLICWWGPEKGG